MDEAERIVSLIFYYHDGQGNLLEGHYPSDFVPLVEYTQAIFEISEDDYLSEVSGAFTESYIKFLRFVTKKGSKIEIGKGNMSKDQSQIFHLSFTEKRNLIIVPFYEIITKENLGKPFAALYDFEVWAVNGKIQRA